MLNQIRILLTKASIGIIWMRIQLKMTSNKYRIMIRDNKFVLEKMRSGEAMEFQLMTLGVLARAFIPKTVENGEEEPSAFKLGQFNAKSVPIQIELRP